MGLNVGATVHFLMTEIKTCLFTGAGHPGEDDIGGLYLVGRLIFMMRFSC